ncbi:MAG: carbohydrate porin [Verrucomicrobiales bacterium]
MNIGENDDGNSFYFWGLQLGYGLETELGRGNYRIIIAGSDTQFLNPSGTNKENAFAGGISCDQELGDVLGVFLRLAWQTEDRGVEHKALYSGGFNFNGSTWGREDDNIGLAYAYLPGGNNGIDHSQAAEVYYRLALNEHFAVTADLQYLGDSLDGEPSPHGWVGGLRCTFEF